MVEAKGHRSTEGSKAYGDTCVLGFDSEEPTESKSQTMAAG